MAKDFDVFRGPGKELDPNKYRPDPRTAKEKFSDMMADPNGFIMVMGIVGSLFIVLSAFGELWTIIAVWLLMYSSKKEFRLPFRIPKTSGLLDPGEPHPLTNEPTDAKGISYFGNERKTKKELWFNNSDMRTHILIFGSTGAGKTEALLSLAYNALVQGSGLIYVDGKGENVLYTKIFAMARTMGREDDVLVINYMTGSRDVFGPQEKKLSNTLNPFSSGGSGGLTELLVSLMDDGGGGGDMWKGRAISLISAIMMALTYMRDAGELLLDVETIREHLILESIIRLYKNRRDFPQHIRAALKAYLVSLPGFQESALKQNDTVMEQHGYLQMQFTKLLGSLADSYGFIFKTNLGEVDFKDVVLNRRILVVLLPALEKSTDELANLGKIIVACLKQMMASALGSTIEGSYAEVVETKPTTSEMPFMTVLDEYGYYAVKGSAVMPAQARSLGFSMIFAGQDLPAFEKASKEEAASIVANCNIKICMKLEDPQSTYELFEKSAGQSLGSNTGSIEQQSGTFGATFTPSKNISLDFKNRIHVLDLKEQREGEAHILFKSALVRARMFYAAPPPPPYIRMNYFVRVEPPDKKTMTDLDKGLKALIRNLTNTTKFKEVEENLEIEEGNVEKLKDLFIEHQSLGLNEAAFAAVASLGTELFDTFDEKMSEYKNKADDNSEEDEEETTIFSNERERNQYIRERYTLNNDNDPSDRYRSHQQERFKDNYREREGRESYGSGRDSRDSYSNNSRDLYGSRERDERNYRNTEDRFKPREDYRNTMSQDDDDDENDEKTNVFIDQHETRQSFEMLDRKGGISREESKETSDRAISDMKQISKYPSDGMPSTKEPEEIMDILHELDEIFDKELDDKENEKDNN